MTEPRPAGPLPGSARPGGSPAAGPADGASSAEGAPPAEGASPQAGESPDPTPFEDLRHRPVAEHVGLFAAEHARLQRELGTIDQV